MTQAKPKGPFIDSKAGLVLLASACTLLWGSASPFIKLAYSLFDESSADLPSLLVFAGVRFALAGLMVVALGSVSRRKVLLPGKRDIGPICVLALFQTALQYSLDYIGLANTTGTSGSIVEATAAFFAILLAALVFGSERLTARKLFGCALGFAGVVGITFAGSNEGMGFSLMGEGLILASCVSAAFSTCFMSRFSQTHDQVLLSGWQFFVGGVALALLGGAAGGSMHMCPPAGWAVFAYIAAVSAVAYTLWGTLLKHHPVSSVTVFGFLTPVFGVILSLAMLGESQSYSPIPLLVSLTLVCVGIQVVNRTTD